VRQSNSDENANEEEKVKNNFTLRKGSEAQAKVGRS
jgi:hypothetical protein